MIYEYAVDPELVKDWVLNRDVGLAGYFGMDERRIISDLDGDWETSIYELVFRYFGEDFGSPEFTDAYQFMQGLTQYMKQGANRGIASSDPWIKKVLHANKEEPFHAILSSSLIPGCDQVITPGVTRELTNIRWYLPTIKVTKKTASAIADQLITYLRLANNIILVDYYFDPNSEEYRSVILALLQKAVSARALSRKLPNVTVISSVDYRNKKNESKEKASTEQYLNFAKKRCEDAKNKLGLYIPIGLTITFKCVALFNDGDEVHNRYLLTDIGGACIPYGLDRKGEDIFDDIIPLYQGQYDKRWKQYHKSEGLNVIGMPVQITGQFK